MNNEVPADKELIDQALGIVVNGGASQRDSTVMEAVSTQAETRFQQTREKELKLEKDVLVAEASAFVGGAALASIPTAGSFAGVGGASAGFGLAISKSEAVEEAGKAPMVGLAAVGGMAAGVAAQTGNAPLMIGVAGTVAAAAIYQTGEIVVDDVINQRDVSRMKASHAELGAALKGQPQEVVSAVDRVLEIVANQTAARGDDVNERMNSARATLAEEVSNGTFVRNLESYQRAVAEKNPEPQL